MLIPFRKRKAKYIAWVATFVSHLDAVFELLKLYHTDTIRKAYMTPQVNMLQEYINDWFEVTTIEIVDGDELGPWVYPVYDSNQFYLDQADGYVFNPQDEFDFDVRVPNTFTTAQIQELAAIINKFKLPGKNFIITKTGT
jgi:hypothetical protein